MRYLGGKSRTAQQIAGYIHNVLRPGQAYYEPFCGACWVTCRVQAQRRYASDANAGMIALWQALQDGWIPPSHVSEDEYRDAQSGVYASEPHLEAFILVGASFSGKWGAGYARDNRGTHSYAYSAYNSLLDKLATLQDVVFTHGDYRDLRPEPNSLIYCDPPYSVTQSGDYRYFGDYAVSKTEWTFNTDEFWAWSQEMTCKGHTVIVSEYNAPAGWSCVQDMPTTTTMRVKGNRGDSRIERLFRYGVHQPLQPALPMFDSIMRAR